MSNTVVRLGRRDVSIEVSPGGEMILRNPDPLRPYPTRFTERLEKWARDVPDRVFLGEREGSSWRTISYREALAKVESIGQALLDRGFNARTPVMTLAINSIDHALIALACMHVGIPSAPVSIGYATLSTDFERLAHAVDRIGPAAIYTHDASYFATALKAVFPQSVEIIATKGSVAGREVTRSRN